MRTLIHKLLTVLLLITFVVPAITAQNEEGWKASEKRVTDLSKPDNTFNYYESKVPSFTLPQLLVTSEGKKVTDMRTWENIRRPEILELFRTHVFGRVPETPFKQEFKVINVDRNALNGAATLKLIDINITSGEKSLVIHLTLFTPNKSGKPAPVFLLIDNRGPANTDPSRQVKSEFWPVEEAIARGYGMAVFSNADVDPDNFDGFKNGIHAIIDKQPRSGDSWGTLAAWAWGAGRCMDYLESDKDADSHRVAVVGHSRGGKTALWAGAVDQRFAMVVSNESGCGGAALARRQYGETVARINTAFPHWFCSNYKTYADNEDAMPVDMHMLLALTSPRALYVDCAADDLWGDPRGSYLSLFHAAPAFNLSGTYCTIPEAMPPLNKQVVSGKLGFHIRDGGHNMLLADWNRFMDFADVVLK